MRKINELEKCEFITNLMPKSNFICTEMKLSSTKKFKIASTEQKLEILLLFWILMYRYCNNTSFPLVLLNDKDCYITKFPEIDNLTFEQALEFLSNKANWRKNKLTDYIPILFINNFNAIDLDYNFDIAFRFENDFFQIMYNENQYSVSTIERMISNYYTLMYNIKKGANCKLSLYNIVSEEEIGLQISFNDIEDCYDNGKTIIDQFYTLFPYFSNRVALTDGITNLTYKEFNEITNYYAASFEYMPGEYVGVISNYDIATCIGIFASLKAGKCIVLINPTYPEDRINYIIRQLNIQILFISSEFQKYSFDNFIGDTIVFTEADSSKRLSHDICNKVDYNSKCYIIYTSGTTGNPKGVIITHKNISIEINYLERRCKFKPCSKTLHLLNYSFDFGLYDILSNLSNGRSLYCLNKKKIKNFRDYVTCIVQNEINNLNITPSLMNILSSFKTKMNSLSYVHLGGEKVTYEMLDQYLSVLNMKCDIYNGYGPCECTVGNALHLITEAEKRGVDRKLSSVPIGNRTDHSELFVLDENLNFVPINSIGELFIAGECIGEGYIEKEFNKNKFINCFLYNEYKYIYRTGDLVRRLENGEIEFVMRADNQIKKNGFRIELSEIDNILLKNSDILDSKTIFSQNKIVSFVVRKSMKTQEYEIRELLKSKIPYYMFPSKIIFLSSLPILASGKIDVKLLEEKMEL